MPDRPSPTPHEGRKQEQDAPHWSTAAPAASRPVPASAAGRTGRRRARTLTAVAIAIAVAAAGAAAALLLTQTVVISPSTGSSLAGSQPATRSGAGIGGPGGGRLLMGGTVTAVSATSITISAQGHTVTAAIDPATRVSGVGGAGAIKVGDRVAMQVAGYGSAHPTAAAIQDPAP